MILRKPKPPEVPVWRLDITPGLVQHRSEVIDGITVTYDKPCWTWNVLRDDLRGLGSYLWDMGVADTEDEATEIGLKKMKKAQRNYAAKTKLGTERAA